MLERRDLRGTTERPTYHRPPGAGAEGVRLGGDGGAGTFPFVTISREAGAGGVSLGQSLVDHLNRHRRSGPEWELWDRRLVEQVSQQHDLPAEWIDTLEDRDFSWLSELFSGLDVGEANEFTVYRRVSEAIRRLAKRGHVVIVGRGGTYITADLPQAVHVCLVARVEYRIAHLARLLGVDRDAAADEVERRDANRQAFWDRYFATRRGVEDFTITLNTQTLDDETMVRSLMPLIEAREGVKAPTK